MAGSEGNGANGNGPKILPLMGTQIDQGSVVAHNVNGMTPTDDILGLDINPAEILKEINYKALESLPDAIIVVNRAGKIVTFNHQAELLFGYDRVEAYNQPIEFLLPGRFWDAHRKLRNDYFRNPQTREMAAERKVLCRDRYGSEFEVQVTLSSMVAIGAGIHAMAVIRRVKG